MKNNIAKLSSAAPAFYSNAGKSMPNYYVARDAAELLMGAGLADVFAVDSPNARKRQLVKLVEDFEGVSAIYVNNFMVIGTSSKKPAGKSKARQIILNHLESGLGMERDVSRAMISVFGTNAADIGSEIAVCAPRLVKESGMVRAKEDVYSEQKSYGINPETRAMMGHAQSLFGISDEEALDMVERVKSIKYISDEYNVDIEIATGVLDNVATSGIPKSEITTRDISQIVGHVSREIAARTRPAPGITEAPKRTLHESLLYPEQMEIYFGETGERIEEDCGDSSEDSDPSIHRRDTDLDIPIVSLLTSKEDDETDNNFNEGIEFLADEFELEPDVAKKVYISLEEAGTELDDNSVAALQAMGDGEIEKYILAVTEGIEIAEETEDGVQAVAEGAESEQE